MRFHEFSKPIITESRVSHAEDLVFHEGSQGALRAVNSMIALIKDRSLLSVKWDGKVALVAGRDANGQFIMTDKAGWGAKGYNGRYTSAKAFVEQKRSKGTSEDYLNQIVTLWPIMESAFPTAFRGFVMGDVMWFPGELKMSDTRFVFTPNTVTYEVDKNSELGKRIAQSKAGFAAHTFISDIGGTGSPLKSTSGLNTGSALCILGPEIKNEGAIKYDPNKIKSAAQFIKSKAGDIDSFLNSATLSSLKMAGLPDILYNYVNNQTRTGDLGQLSAKFIPWVQSNTKLSKPMASKVVSYATEHNHGLKAVFEVFDLVSGMKNDIIGQLDKYQGPILQHIAGKPGGEGYVVANGNDIIKYVPRTKFSAANFARH